MPTKKPNPTYLEHNQTPNQTPNQNPNQLRTRETSWCTPKYLKKVKSMEILIKRKSIDKLKKHKSVKESEVIKFSPKKISTPKRVVKLMSPSSFVEIKGSKDRNKYSSCRRLDFL